MKTIIDDIKKNEFKKVYLLYGDEDYLKKQYRDKLKQALVGDDTMNFSYYEGDGVDIKQVISMCETLPFFSDRRVVILENSGAVKSANEELSDYIKELPDYLVLILVEKEIDKRNKVYKAIDKVGYVCELKPQTTATLKKWIVGILGKEGLKISVDGCELLLSKTGADMNLIRQEIDKLISYCEGKEGVTAQDVEAVCSTQTTSHIFDMIEAMANHNQTKALELYYELLTLKEPPMRILYLIVRQFNGILQAKELSSMGLPSKDVASKMGVAPFIAAKYLSQSKYFTITKLKEALNECVDVEESVKQGRLNDKLAVELIIVKYSENVK